MFTNETKQTQLAQPDDTEELTFKQTKRLLLKDLRKAEKSMTDDEARFLLSTYYQLQTTRIRLNNQAKALERAEKPNELTTFLTDETHELEKLVKPAMEIYVSRQPGAWWIESVNGVGPVLAAGLYCRINFKGMYNKDGEYIPPVNTAGKIHSYAGLTPTSIRERGKKINFNPGLKVTCYLIGEQFALRHKNPKCYYGKVYSERKLYEQAKNEKKDYAEQAAKIIASGKYKKDTDAKKCYENGMLPPAHIDARCRRYAVKIFLSHMHQVVYETVTSRPVPVPYPIAHMGHCDISIPPGYTPLT